MITNENSISYASADFPDASDISPASFDLTNDNNYSTAINNAMERHLNEVKEKQNPAILVQNSWKKKFKEFLHTKNTKLLEFLSSKLKVHPVLGQLEFFFQKFGKYNINSNSLKDIVLDTSGVNISEEIDALLLSKEFESSEKYVQQTQFLMDQYKLVADKILDQENLLKMKLALLDSMNQKLIGFQNLGHNEHFEELMTSITKYIDKTYEDNNIEEDYKNIIELYRKFFHLRELIKTVRTVELSEKEPLCTICFNEQIQFAIVPCGHTYCSSCIKRHVLTCSVCRGNIRDRIRVYFT